MFRLLTASMGLFKECQLHSTNVTQSGSSDKRAGTNSTTANEGPYYYFLYSRDMLYYWFRWHDGQSISSNVCTGAVPDQPLHYESQTAKLIFFYMPCLSEIIKCLGGNAINFFLSESMRHVRKCTSMCNSSFFLSE